MSVQIILFALLLVTVVSLPSLGQLPSTDQTTWHGGISATTYQDYFDPYFLDETGIAWQSTGQLSLEYPIFNETIYGNLTLGKQAEAGDFTGDGYPDIVVVSFSSISTVVLLVNPGISTSADEEWNPVVISSSLPQCQSVSSTDIDSDGDLDVIIGFSGTSGIAWLENPGTSARWPYHSVGNMTGITSVDCGDIDLDGDADILFCSALKDTLGWMNNLDGIGGNWACEVISSSNYPYQASITDIDSDGVPDAAVCYRIEGKICWFKRNITDNTWTEYAVADVPQAFNLSAGDYNGDSFVDILACGLAENSAFLCTSNSSSGTTWSTVNLDLSLSGSKACILVDLENDGDLDIAVSTQTQDSVIVLSNLDGLGQNWFKTSLVIEKPVHFQPIDADMDGSFEIVCLCRDEAKVLSAHPGTYSETGTLTSVVSSVVCFTDNQWGNIVWDSWEPPGTSISFQVRNAENYNNMGEWSDTISTSGTYLGDLFPDICYYIQYRVFLNSDSPDSSPFLYSVNLEGYIGDVCDYSEAVTDVPLVIINENPSHETIAVTLCPSEGIRELMIYDVSGRLVRKTSFQPDNSSVLDIVEGLSTGVYHIVATARGRREILKVCVIK